MPTARNNTPPGTFLWKCVYDINHDNGGFTWTSWLAEKTETEAYNIGVELGGRIRRLLPADAEVYDATAYKWDNSRNGMFLDGKITVGATDITAIGQGLYGSQLAVPAVLNCDAPRTCVKLRLEDKDLAVIPRKFNLIPDAVAGGGLITSPPDPVKGLPLAAPSLGGLTDVWAVQFNLFMQAVCFYTVHLIGKPTQGGNYTYQTWKNVFLRRVGVKKGGRVFIG